MSLLKRIRDLGMSNVNALIDKAEDPTKMINQYIRDMEEEIVQLEAATSRQIALENRTKEQLDNTLQKIGERQQDAVKALEAGQEDLARRTLEDKQELQLKANSLQSDYEKAKKRADELRNKLSNMKDEFVKKKDERDMLIARADAAKAQRDINRTLSGFGDSAVRGFSRMEEQVSQLEAEAEASAELMKPTTLDEELSALHKPNVDDELNALKASLGK